MNAHFKSTTFLTPQIFLYSRVSSTQQLAGHGLERQSDNNDREARALAEKYHLAIAPPISDPGKSAYRGHNLKDDAGLGQFLSDIDAGNIAPGSWLVVDEFSRLTRLGHRKLLNIMTRILDSGVNVMVNRREFLHDEEGMEDAINLIMAIIQGAKDHDASREKAKLISAAKAKHRDEVIKGNRVTVNKRGIVEWCELINETKPGTGEVVLIPERATVIRQIFDLYLGGFGYTTIATQLNDAKVPAFRKPETGWQDSYINRLITGRAVLGEQTLKGGTVVMAYPPVVDLVTWERAQEVRLAKPKTGGRRTTDIPNLFTGLLCCHHCGSSMLLLNKGRKTGRTAPERQIVCSNAKRHAGCQHDTKWWHRHFEQAVVETIINHVNHAENNEPTVPDDGTATLQTQLHQAIEDRDFWSAEFEANRRDENARNKYRAAVERVIDLEQQIVRTKASTQSTIAIARAFWVSSDAVTVADAIITMPRPLLAQHLQNLITEVQVDTSSKTFTVILRDGCMLNGPEIPWLE